MSIFVRFYLTHFLSRDAASVPHVACSRYFFSFLLQFGIRILSPLRILERIVAFRFPSQLLARKNLARSSLAEGLLHVAKAHPQPPACPRGLFPVRCALGVDGDASLVPRHLRQRWPSCASILHTTRGHTEK